MRYDSFGQFKGRVLGRFLSYKAHDNYSPDMFTTFSPHERSKIIILHQHVMPTNRTDAQSMFKYLICFILLNNGRLNLLKIVHDIKRIKHVDKNL